MNQAPPGALGHVVRQKLRKEKKRKGKKKSGLANPKLLFGFDERDPGVKREGAEERQSVPF